MILSRIHDHIALTSFLYAQKSIPLQAVACLQQWGVTLSVYQYKMKFCNTQDCTNVDGLFCLPLQVAPGADKQYRLKTSASILGEIMALPATAAQLGMFPFKIVQ